MTHPTQLLYPYAVGDADAAAQATVEDHLAACAECRADVDALRDMHARLSRLPLESPDVSFDRRLRARIAAAPAPRVTRWAWASAGAAAAAIVILAVLSPWTPRVVPQPPSRLPAVSGAADARPVFMVIFQEDVGWRDGLDAAARRARSDAFRDWFAALDRQGRVVPGGKRLRDEGGRVVLTGGKVIAPGTSQEILTGFVLVRAADYDEAVAVARECPVVTTGRGRVIVRQVS